MSVFVTCISVLALGDVFHPFPMESYSVSVENLPKNTSFLNKHLIFFLGGETKHSLLLDPFLCGEETPLPTLHF